LGLNGGLLCRHACLLTTWGTGGRFSYTAGGRMTMTPESGSLPFVERTSSHRLRWPCRLVSELIPCPLLLRDEPFFMAMSGFGRVGFGLSQRSRPSGRRPSESGHFYIWLRSMPGSAFGAQILLRTGESPRESGRCLHVACLGWPILEHVRPTPFSVIAGIITGNSGGRVVGVSATALRRGAQ
jgi:hypothetical protein